MGNADRAIERLRRAWYGLIVPSAARATVAAVVAVVLAALVVARIGTLPARLVGAGLIVAALASAVGRAVIGRRRRRDDERVVTTSLGAVDRRLGEAAVRARRLQAVTLIDTTHGSAELAALHFGRLLARAPYERIAERANGRAWRFTLAALVVALGATAFVASDPLRVVEGLDVLAARGDVAPLPLRWLDDAGIEIDPPAYLHQPRRAQPAYGAAAVPVGSTLTIRGAARRSDRPLFLSDGKNEVAFADDGSGGLVAHYRVEGDAELTVLARFGDVAVVEPRTTAIDAIPDLAPTVRLEGAPRTVRLLDEPRIPIHYEATDDHGLGEVNLVLRAGTREERRPLSKPQGGRRVDRGGIDLLASDPFLKKSYLPVEIVVEARDTDPVKGPKIGRSASIFVIPAKVGEREALRYAAVREGRDALVDLYAARSELGAPNGRTLRRHVAREAELQDAASAALEAMLGKTFGGLRMPAALQALVRGHLERLEKSRAAEVGAQIPLGHDELVALTERATLALDSALSALGTSDTQATARKLSEVATEAARAIAASEEPATRERAEQSLAAAQQVLGEGGEQLLQLGWLGLDLGEIVANGLRRIGRAWEPRDRYHARLAAEDLAARLRNPFPSFGSSGGGHGGVESGGMGPPQSGEGQGSEAAEDMAKLAELLDELRREHAEQMDEVERALQQAVPPEVREAMKEKLEQRAEAVRRAVEQMPGDAGEATSARSEVPGKSAEGRAHAEAMAEALERGDLSEAIRRGEQALQSLGKAEQGGKQDPSGFDRELGEKAGAAKSEVGRHLDDTKRDLEEAQRRASEHAKEELGAAGKKERSLADKARDLREKSTAGDAALPESMLRRLEQAGRAMDEAAQRLEEGQGHEGAERQRDAQRMLEMVMPEDRDPHEGQDHGEQDSDDGKVGGDVPVPGKSRSEDADAFRQRVLEGLGGPMSPALRDAIRRYAEGLLR